MKKLAIDAVLGIVVAALLAAATPAGATAFYNKASPAGQNLYLSVAGGVQCPPASHGGCGIPAGKPIILWPGGSNSDQNWYVRPDGAVWVYGVYLSVPRSSTAEGVGLVDWYEGNYPNLTQDQIWYVWPAEAWGAPFPGCYVFYNSNSGLVASAPTVAQGKQVIQYHLIAGLPGSEAGWHKDQFWCAQ